MFEKSEEFQVDAGLYVLCGVIMDYEKKVNKVTYIYLKWKIGWIYINKIFREIFTCCCDGEHRYWYSDSFVCKVFISYVHLQLLFSSKNIARAIIWT